MNKTKTIVRRNIFLIVLGIVIISLFVINFILKQVEYNKIYTPGTGNDGEIYYIEHKYQDNEYKVINMDEFDMINLYYNDFKKKLVENPIEAWKVLSETNKEEMFAMEEANFVSFAKEIVTKNTINNKIEKYKKSSGKYTIVDTENRMYLIEDNGVWNYHITYLGQSNY